MEVQLTPEVQARLDRLTDETGRSKEELVHDALTGYFDELVQTRALLQNRYDGLKRGEVALISPEQIAEHFNAKSAARHT